MEYVHQVDILHYRFMILDLPGMFFFVLFTYKNMEDVHVSFSFNIILVEGIFPVIRKQK